MGLAPQVPEIQSLIEAELRRQEAMNMPKTERADTVSLLDELFRSVLRETWA